MIPRIATAAALLAPAAGAGQETWRPPTAAEVLAELTVDSPVDRIRRAGSLAGDLLRQEFGPMPEAEIEALADTLADVILSLPTDTYTDEKAAVRRAARLALWSAARRPGGYMHGFGYFTADNLPGTPSEAAFDALVRVYETRAARALAGGGEDPFLEAAHAGQRQAIRDALRDIFEVDSRGRGEAYLLELFAASRPPPEPTYKGTGWTGWAPFEHTTLWCEAGNILHEHRIQRDPRPRGPDRARWLWLCRAHRETSPPPG